MISAYLDTNVISGLAKGEYSDDVAAALIALTALAKDGRIDLRTSEIAADELAMIPARYRRQHYVIYNLIKNVAVPAAYRAPQQIVARGGRAMSWLRIPTRNMALLRELEALIPAKRNPEKVQARNRDIEHLHRFTQVGLDYFLTEDHRSILCHKARLLALGIKAVCSLELLAAVK